jgi:hypothetical protein
VPPPPPLVADNALVVAAVSLALAAHARGRSHAHITPSIAPVTTRALSSVNVITCVGEAIGQSNVSPVKR